MKVLLTGAKGNLGQALQRQPGTEQWLSLNRADWKNLPQLVAESEYIIHAASDLTTPLSANPQAVMESNLLSTAWLLEALKTRPIKRLLFISSCAVYGHSDITTEEIELVPISVNGITKLLNEKIIEEFCTKNNIEYQILRVFNTYGGTDRFSIISHLERAVKEKRPFTMFNNGISQRDFIHVDDVAYAVLAVLNAPIHHRIINVGSGETTRIRDVVRAFQKKNSTLELVEAKRQEAEYSRADITKLREILPDYQFRSVLDIVTAR